MTTYTMNWLTAVMYILDEMDVETFVTGRDDDPVIYVKTDECKRFSIESQFGIGGDGDTVDLIFSMKDPCQDACTLHINVPNFGDFVSWFTGMVDSKKSIEEFKPIKKTYATQLESIEEFISIYLDFWEG